MTYEHPGQHDPHFLRVIVVDDDPLARRGMHRLLERAPDVCVVGDCVDGAEALTAVRQLHPDVLLLDVEMPGADGLAVASALPPDAPYVIFVSAHDQYAVRAFRAHALDYVTKPVSPTRLAEALERARGQRRQRQLVEWANRVRSAISDSAPPFPAEEPYLAELRVRIAMRDLIVRVADIDWIEADSYYARLHVGARSYLIREPLQRLEGRLDPRCFARVHRSAIVNFRRIREILFEPGGHRVLVLTSGARVRVSRARWGALAAKIRERTRVTPVGVH